MTLAKRFENEKINRTYRRVDEMHNLDWYIGYNEEGKKSLVLIVNGEFKKYESTKFILVKLEKRVDEKMYLSFNLIDDKYKEIFFKFCEDIIETTRNIDNKCDVIDFILMRWNMWRFAFKNNNKSLTENEIKGLIGEILFLKNVMIPQFGIERSINSWQGPLNYHKDYEINDKWYEIKTISDNSLIVKITSIQQLDNNEDKKGELVVITLSNTNKENDNYITISNVIASVDKEIDNMDLKRIFWGKLNNLGYVYEEEYENYIYKLEKICRYDVLNEHFPRITSANLKKGIVNVSYEISINELENFLLKE